jgi:hypothetical protein
MSPTTTAQEVPAPDTTTASNPRLYQHAITKGQEVLVQDGSKAAAAREIFTILHNEHRDVVLKAFIEGASVTVKGAPTYFYNISRKARRVNKADADE